MDDIEQNNFPVITGYQEFLSYYQSMIEEIVQREQINHT